MSSRPSLADGGPAFRAGRAATLNASPSTRVVIAATAFVLACRLLALPALAAQYTAQQSGEIVRLEDSAAETAVSILPSVGNIGFELKVKGQNVLRWPFASIDEFKTRPSMNGIPFLGPWANRLDEQAFYANGRRYAFDMELGNVRGAIPIHGFLTTNTRWRVMEVKADAMRAATDACQSAFNKACMRVLIERLVDSNQRLAQAA